jgi:hypothetical protein
VLGEAKIGLRYCTFSLLDSSEIGLYELTMTAILQ